MKSKSVTNKKCEKCKGESRYMYDENHAKPCEFCCTHYEGWWKLEKHYGNDNGKYACQTGCGTIIENPRVKMI